MFQSATDKFKQSNQTPIGSPSQNAPITPGKKVSLDTLFQSAVATPKSLDHSTPIHPTNPIQMGSTQPPTQMVLQPTQQTDTTQKNDLNLEKTKNLKNMFGLSGIGTIVNN